MHRLAQRWAWFSGSILLAVSPAAVALQLGDGMEAVRAELGQPESVIEIGTRQTLYFPRGKVELVDGKVVELHLVSEEEAAARLLREEQERARREQEQRERHAALAAEGREQRDRTLADTAFLAKPASQRAAYWQSFAKRYPGVPLPTDYDAALNEMSLERQAAQAQAAEDARLRSLEDRVRNAETRAMLAEDAARRAERRNRYAYPLYPVVVPSRPIIVVPQPLPCEDPDADPSVEPGNWKSNALGFPPVHGPKHRFDGSSLDSYPRSRSSSGVRFSVGRMYGSRGPAVYYGAPERVLSAVEQPAPLPARR